MSNNKALSNSLEYCVTKLALRYKPPTFQVGYKISSQDAILSALSSDIYHIEIVIGGLTPSSNPSGIAKILIENCGMLCQSSSTCQGGKWAQAGHRSLVEAMQALFCTQPQSRKKTKENTN
jgi:hypothetical protein